MNIKEFAGVNALLAKPNGEKMSHEELYTKVVNGIGLEICERYMPASIKELRDALEEDPHLNTIPLQRWDNMHITFRHVFRRINVNRLSMSDMNCTLKQAARMLVARDYPEIGEREPEKKEGNGMNKPLSLRMKWKLFRRYLKENKDGVVVSCAYCDSIDIAFDNQLEHLINDRRIYKSRYTCNNCGATCKNIQEWTKETSRPVREENL